MFFASGLLALPPSVAHSLSKSATGYGFLLGVFGIGAVVGALVLQPLRSLYPLDTVVSGGVVTVGAAMIATGNLRTFGALAPVMLTAGAAWICFVSLISALIQTLTADWVRARVLAMFLLVFQGSIAAGSAVWGALAQRIGIRAALDYAGFGAIASIGLSLAFKLPNVVSDMSPWIHWRTPPVLRDIGGTSDEGPVLVIVEYTVPRERQRDFETVIEHYGRIRRRDGASRWEMVRDVETENLYLEVFFSPVMGGTSAPT
jgi:MFS family permease